MIVVTKKNGTPRERAPGLRRYIAAIVALATLAVVAGAWFWITRQPARVELGLPHGVIVVGCGAFVAALIAGLRTMSFWDVLELAWNLLVGLFALIGAVLKGIWTGFLSLIGWD